MANGELILTNNYRGECLLCGSCPTDDDGHILPMVHAVGMDVNWGEDINVCQPCGGVIADLLGRRSEEVFKKLERDLANTETELRDLKEEHAAQSTRVQKILEGRKAIREEREAVKASV
jgi:5-methylcytosine-specific restriction endonuclease McrA